MRLQIFKHYFVKCGKRIVAGLNRGIVALGASEFILNVMFYKVLPRALKTNKKALEGKKYTFKAFGLITWALWRVYWLKLSPSRPFIP